MDTLWPKMTCVYLPISDSSRLVLRASPRGCWRTTQEWGCCGLLSLLGTKSRPQWQGEQAWGTCTDGSQLSGVLPEEQQQQWWYVITSSLSVISVIS